VICDRDPKWSRAMEALLANVGDRVVRTPAAAPNCNAHAERFVRSITFGSSSEQLRETRWRST
jgi:hypothetical protein